MKNDWNVSTSDEIGQVNTTKSNAEGNLLSKKKGWFY